MEPAHGAQADVEVEELTKSHVERTNAATNRRREWALDANQVVAECFDGLVGKPITGFVEGLLTSQHFNPGNFLAVLLGRCVKHQLGRWPNVDTSSVAFNERNNRNFRNVKGAVGPHSDLLRHGSILGRAAAAPAEADS